MAVKLHRCRATFAKTPGHPCWKVQKALDEAGVDYELIKEPLLRFNRGDYEKRTGTRLLPAIELADGTMLREGSSELVARIEAGRLAGESSPAQPPAMPKTVFITGASSGIGRALARELARRGYDLFLTARTLEALEEVRAEIVARGPARRVEVRRLDVTDDDDVVAALAEAAETLGRCDIVVANAGVGGSGRVGHGHTARGRLIVETNLIGAIATIDAAVALFRRQGGAGQVVGVGSVAGARGLPGSASYSASKAGIAIYLEAVRAETHSE